ncbi:MAG TPA: hypothetical protein VFJ02_10555 [Vicinamibacterales bacterium]|nr:hypothetical protein [Vicinamibacterales bacterium]
MLRTTRAGQTSWVVAVVAIAGWTSPAVAQEHATVRADVLFYGDDTEFRNRFREGETIFGAAVRGAAELVLNDRVTLAAGAFGNLRFGSDDAFEIVRPVLSLTIAGRRSAFVFGTLSTPVAGAPPGPDRTGPHGLLPPLQRETLAFDRPYEAGIAWSFAGSAVRHGLWINWQRLNTREHRERFDAGVAADVRLADHVALPCQLHVVHEGGQLFASGPVADSVALATGLRVHGKPWNLEAASIEAYGLLSRFVPDRSDASRSRDGAGFFARGAIEHHGWRGHLIAWRGDDFIKDEGDPNYLSIRRDGRYYRGVRDYAEAGLTRTFKPAAGVLVEASGRLHRIEKDYEYSFRILARAAIAFRLR